MPTEETKFFCASYINHVSMIRCSHQCHMCKTKEQEMKMANIRPVFLLVAYFSDNRPTFQERGTEEKYLVDKAKDLLLKDSKITEVFIYRGLSKVERAEFKITQFN